MRPETVLNLKPGDDPAALRDQWINEYDAFAKEYLNTEDLAKTLSERAKRAYALIKERTAAEPASSHDETFYIEEAARRKAEDASLDGDFPLGNEEDAAFAGHYFSIPELVSIQLGYHRQISCGNFSSYNFDVLIRKGFVAECDGEWMEAARCYEGVSTSESVQDREILCRRKAKAEGERLYAEAQEHMASGAWSDVYHLLERAADMSCAEAETDLGLALAYGQFGARRDTEEALKHLKNAARRDVARAAFAIVELYDGGVDIDAFDALEMCEKAASQGDEKAKERLADGFDLRPKREIIKEQIDKGSIDALWFMYLQCEKENDEDGAAKWFDRALEAGQTDALLQAAKVYADQCGDLYDDALADQYLRRAADNGSVEAIKTLGKRELIEDEPSFWESEPAVGEIRERHEKQFAWTLLAAEAGDAPSMAAVSEAYRRGYPVQKDETSAFLWASRAADEDDAAGLYQAAYLYENGVGTEKDEDAALLLYLRAADMGVRAAMLRLAKIFENKGDKKKAARYRFMSGEGRD